MTPATGRFLGMALMAAGTATGLSGMNHGLHWAIAGVTLFALGFLIVWRVHRG